MIKTIFLGATLKWGRDQSWLSIFQSSIRLLTPVSSRIQQSWNLSRNFVGFKPSNVHSATSTAWTLKW